MPKSRLHPSRKLHPLARSRPCRALRWIPARRRYLFPAKVLSRLFRGKLLAALAESWKKGELTCKGLEEPSAFSRLKDALYKKEWVVYAKTPFGGPAQVSNYVGRYTHRVAISSQRLLAIDEAGVRFVTRGEKTATLTPDVSRTERLHAHEHDSRRRFLPVFIERLSRPNHRTA